MPWKMTTMCRTSGTTGTETNIQSHRAVCFDSPVTLLGKGFVCRPALRPTALQTMIIHDYDIATEPLISLEAFYGPKKQLIEKCLILFSQELQAYLLNNYACSAVAQIGACNGCTNIYTFDFDGESVAFYLSAVGSAGAADYCYQAHWLTGAAKFVMFGSCGSLDREATHGKFVIPTESYRGDGCSYYFAPPSDYLPIKNADTVAAIFEERKLPYVKGRVWTTDSMLRETVGLVQKRKQEGCIAVEMELAGVEALCDFYGLQLFDFLEAGDVLEESGYDMQALSGANHSLGKLMIALEILKKI